MLFEFLGARIVGSRFLDLCAGSGAVGIEALSRGASHATFVDRSARMCNLIEQNLERCGVATAQAAIVLSDATAFLRRATRREETFWDIAFFDPPYALDYAPVLEIFGANQLLKLRSGVLIAEHHCENSLTDNIGSLRRWRTIRQGESCLSFYERK
jgi:16S rRNA (guanine(966)-N(2))-methyltransferase RsmD